MLRLSAFLASLLLAAGAFADSSGPRLAAYYERFLAVCGSNAYEWSGDAQPRRIASAVRQVAVGRDTVYLLGADAAVRMREEDSPWRTLRTGVREIHAGRSGLMLIDRDGSLWHFASSGVLGFGARIEAPARHIADDVLTASVGDSADYYVGGGGRLYVKGRAHRGQYGDGRLRASDDFIAVASEVVQVRAHTGHALLLKRDGSVWGTGGNLYGPLGTHGLGDKATTWGQIFAGARAIATGSSHSVAIRQDNSLWIWGRNESLEPRQVMRDVDTVAAGIDTTIAIADGALWQWRTGAQPRRLRACAGKAPD